MAVVITVGVTACLPGYPGAPHIVGAIGISVDTENHPIIVLTWCDGATPEDVTVSHDEPYSGVPGAGSLGDRQLVPSIAASNHSVEDAKFSAPPLDGRSASVRLDAPADGWTVEPEPLVLKPGIAYDATGGKGRGYSRFSTSNVNFTAEDMAKLKPGRVLIQRAKESPLKTPEIPGVDTEMTWVDRVISREEFDREGQDPTYCRY
ncbi:hypothetical protein [Sphaerisporangium fuscum]|uniref:hypothetical protein n=1 Tax=Sphaerisporangium fuscum TaxID=2835868 RepID=UPI001BDD1336|nr:hypothetical protein [Sphaerisporangium fuscum]